MQRIKVDTTGSSFSVAGLPQAVTDFQTKATTTDENGVQLFSVRLLITSPDGLEINAVKFPSRSAPSFNVGQTVVVSELVATPYVASGSNRASISLRAGSIEADKSVRSAAS